MKTLKLLPLAVLVLCTLAAVRPNHLVSNSTSKIATADANAAEEDLFKAFLNEFEKTELPYSLSIDRLNKAAAPATLEALDDTAPKKQETNALSRDYDELLPSLRNARFSRRGPAVIKPEVTFPAGEVMAVIYSSKQAFQDGVSFHLATFSKKGKFLHETAIASKSYLHLSTCTIDKNLVVQSNAYNAQWKKDPARHGYEDNEITDYKIANTSFKKIGKDGSLEDIKSHPVTDRAALN